jgi:hypothetical protein
MLAPVAGDTRQWRATVTVTTVHVDDVTITPTVEVTDAVGHLTSGAPLLPVRFVAARLGPCAPLTAAEDVDMDGDGQKAANTPRGIDCDDGDPLVFDGAPELPGDGVDNGCRGGADAPIDDGTGVFVDPSAGADDDACGTAIAPCQTPLQAQGRAAALGLSRMYLVEADQAVLQSGVALRLDVVGSLVRDGDVWRRGGAPSAVAADSVDAAVRVIDGVHLPFTPSFAPGSVVVLRDSVLLAGADVHARAMIVDSEVVGQLTVTAAGTRVLRSRTDAISLSAPGMHIAWSTIDNLVAAATGATLDVSSSVVRRSLTCNGCARLGVWYSTLLLLPNDTGIRVDAGAPVVRTDNNIFVVTGSSFTRAFHFVSMPSSFMARGNRLACAGSCHAVAAPGFIGALADDMNDAGAPGAGNHVGNVDAIEAGVDDDGQLALPAGAEPTPALPALADAPAVVAVDAFGDCRAEDGPAGADATP